MTTATITSRTRKLGYGWTSTPHGPDPAAHVAAPSTTGSIAAIRAEVTRAARLNRGNSYWGVYFYDGKRIASFRVPETADADGPHLLDALSSAGSVTLTLAGSYDEAREREAEVGRFGTYAGPVNETHSEWCRMEEGLNAEAEAAL